MKRASPAKYDQQFIRDRVDLAGECWEWRGAISSCGYGNVLDHGSGKTYKAHRISFEAFVEPIGDRWVLHKCDNRKCCNPDHLFLGTHKDNMADMARKKRAHSMPGTSNPNAKLSKEDIAIIKAIPRRSRGGMTNAEIARKYGVNTETVRRYRVGSQFKFRNVGGAYHVCG